MAYFYLAPPPPPIGGGRGIVMPMSVCLCVCVCVCLCVCPCFRKISKCNISAISQPIIMKLGIHITYGYTVTDKYRDWCQNVGEYNTYNFCIWHFGLCVIVSKIDRCRSSDPPYEIAINPIFRSYRVSDVIIQSFLNRSRWNLVHTLVARRARSAISDCLVYLSSAYMKTIPVIISLSSPYRYIYWYIYMSIYLDRYLYMSICMPIYFILPQPTCADVI